MCWYIMYVFIFSYMPQAPQRWILDRLKEQLKDVVHLSATMATTTVSAGSTDTLLEEISTPASWKDYHGNRCVHERKVSVND